MSTKKFEKTIGDNPIHPIKNAPVYFGGLTKREYFAAMAMQGLCANTNYEWHPLELSETSVRIAEYLITQLNQQQPK